MIKAVIFDLGGVLFSNGTKCAITKLKNKYDISDKAAEEIFRSKEARDFKKGLISSEEFWEHTKEKFSYLDSNEVRRIWYDSYTPNIDVFELIKLLKSKGFKLGIISGNIEERVDYLNNRYDFRQLFDVEVYSFDNYTTKPDKKMWIIALEKLNLSPEECVYFDDWDGFVDIANSLGFRAYLFTNVLDAKKDLENLDIKIDE